VYQGQPVRDSLLQLHAAQEDPKKGEEPDVRCKKGSEKSAEILRQTRDSGLTVLNSLQKLWDAIL